MISSSSSSFPHGPVGTRQRLGPDTRVHIHITRPQLDEHLVIHLCHIAITIRLVNDQLAAAMHARTLSKVDELANHTLKGLFKEVVVKDRGGAGVGENVGVALF